MRSKVNVISTIAHTQTRKETNTRTIPLGQYNASLH